MSRFRRKALSSPLPARALPALCFVVSPVPKLLLRLRCRDQPQADRAGQSEPPTLVGFLELGQLHHPVLPLLGDLLLDVLGAECLARMRGVFARFAARREPV